MPTTTGTYKKHVKQLDIVPADLRRYESAWAVVFALLVIIACIGFIVLQSMSNVRSMSELERQQMMPALP